MKKYFSLIPLLVSFACNNNDNKNANEAEYNTSATNVPAALHYTVVKIYPHDTSSYTEGLFWQNNALYESTGLEGKSKLLKINIETGKPQKEIQLDKKYFGEGISIFKGKLYQLTWQTNKVFVYDTASWKKIKEFDWPHEGWGMTHDSTHLIISIGDSNLYFVNPQDFKLSNILAVSDNNGPVGNINELEYVNGYIYANQYLTNNILKINAQTGMVEARADLTNIMNANGVHFDAQNLQENAGVLNGIAYNAQTNSFYITGKLWPALFEIKLN